MKTHKVRSQIQFDPDQLEKVHNRAAAEQVSVAEFVRRAVDRYMQDARAESAAALRRRAASVVGRYASGVAHTSMEHDAALSDAFLS